MTAISDIPIVEPITGNKRHTYYGVQQPSAPPAKPGASSKDSDKQPLLGSSSSDSKPLLSENLILLEDKNVDGPEAVANPVLQGESETTKKVERLVEIENDPSEAALPCKVMEESEDKIVVSEFATSQTITSCSRTVETTTFKSEQSTGGEKEMIIEHQHLVTMQAASASVEETAADIDYDEALAQAIQEATAMNPHMTVEKIEIENN